ncbi:hypothetical protein GCM10027444_35830 [Actinopolyspora lacussalsi]
MERYQKEENTQQEAEKRAETATIGRQWNQALTGRAHYSILLRIPECFTWILSRVLDMGLDLGDQLSDSLPLDTSLTSSG